MLVGLSGITRQISHHQPYLPSTSCFSLRPQFVRKQLPAPPVHHPLPASTISSVSPFSPSLLTKLFPSWWWSRGWLKLLSAKNIKSGCGSGQCSVFSLQRCGDSQTELLFLLELFLLTARYHTARHNYQVFLFNKKKVH